MKGYTSKMARKLYISFVFVFIFELGSIFTGPSTKNDESPGVLPKSAVVQEIEKLQRNREERRAQQVSTIKTEFFFTFRF
jgi:hypothetical protein